MGVTRFTSLKIFDQCRKCKHREQCVCTYDHKNMPVTYRRKSKKLNCPKNVQS